MCNMYTTISLPCSAPQDHGYAKALTACEASLRALGRHQLDLYLVHWPGVKGWRREDPRNASLRRDTWTAMEELLRTGTHVCASTHAYTCASREAGDAVGNGKFLILVWLVMKEVVVSYVKVGNARLQVLW